MAAAASPIRATNSTASPEFCRNVLIEDCDIDTGDDAIAIKSGIAALGRARGLGFAGVTRGSITSPALAIANCQDVSFRSFSAPAGPTPFLLLRAATTCAIRFDDALADRRDAIVFEKDATSAAVSFARRG